MLNAYVKFSFFIISKHTLDSVVQTMSYAMRALQWMLLKKRDALLLLRVSTCKKARGWIGIYSGRMDQLLLIRETAIPMGMDGHESGESSESCESCESGRRHISLELLTSDAYRKGKQVRQYHCNK